MAPVPPRPKLSTKEKINLLTWAVFVAPVKILFSVSRATLMAWSRGLPIRNYVSCGFYRVLFGDLGATQVQAIVPGTLETYFDWLKNVQEMAPNGPNGAVASRLKEKIDRLTPTSSIMWLGNPLTADKVVLYFHGGGYKGPLTPGALDLCVQSFMLADPNVEVAVAVLQYVLVPARYPIHLRQAADALTHLLKLGFGPEKIIIGGDSAGANLAVQLLSHLLHPHPDIEVVELKGPLLGVFTVSPWLTVRTDDVAFRENDGIDMLSAHIAEIGVIDILSGTKFEAERRQGKGWAFALDVDESWLDGLGRILRSLYITVGQNEVFRSQGITFADIVRRRSPDVKLRLDLSKNEAHNFFFIEGQHGVFGDATKRMKEWTASVITGK
ncbi:alpha/beta-hydrolase [Xylaria nigripes]|nr:alpha/beta-hydrolase [Xylaria nigripes]